MATDYYELLGVSRNASEDEIKRAFRKIAREHHPDANPGDAASEDRFKEAQLAYETLRDPERRRRYDMFGPEVRAGGAGGPGFDADFTVGLGDLFDAFFGGSPFGGGGRRGRGPAGPPRGADLEATLEIEFEEAVFGS